MFGIMFFLFGIWDPEYYLVHLGLEQVVGIRCIWYLVYYLFGSLEGCKSGAVFGIMCIWYLGP